MCTLPCVYSFFCPDIAGMQIGACGEIEIGFPVLATAVGGRTVMIEGHAVPAGGSMQSTGTNLYEGFGRLIGLEVLLKESAGAAGVLLPCGMSR